MIDGFRGPAPEGADRSLAAARRFDGPILMVRGAWSDVLTAEIAAEFCENVPHAARVDVARAGHMVAGDTNDRFVRGIVPFLDRCLAAGA
jgi:peroxiredoxin